MRQGKVPRGMSTLFLFLRDTIGAWHLKDGLGEIY
jgi:hypothetical protein